MDLSSFTKPKKKQEAPKTLLDNKDIKVVKEGENYKVTIKTKEALSIYQNQLFLAPTHSKIAKNKKDYEKFFNESIEEGVEGIMCKNLKSPYRAGLRVGSMAKLKEQKEDLDVVIVGAQHGTGKRAGFFSSFYVAVKDDMYQDETREFLNIGKVASGVKELDGEGATMQKLTQLLKPLIIKEEKGIIHIKPKIILQVRYQDIQQSTSYSSGYALRFPRIISLREDKDLEEINSIADIINLTK